MPELDGFGVLEIIQRDSISRDIPVIVLTGQVLTQEDMARLNRGVTNVLKKGLFSIEETLTHVEAALARNKHLGSETQRLVRKAMAVYPRALYRADLTQGCRAFGRDQQRIPGALFPPGNRRDVGDLSQPLSDRSGQGPFGSGRAESDDNRAGGRIFERAVFQPGLPPGGGSISQCIPAGWPVNGF